MDSEVFFIPAGSLKQKILYTAFSPIAYKARKI